MSRIRSTPHRIVVSGLLAATLAVLVGCATPLPNSTPTGDASSESAAAVLQAYRQYGGEIVTLDAKTPTVTVDISGLVGTIPAVDLTQGNPPCAGFVQAVPSFVFTLAKDENSVKVGFAGNTTATLVVVAEGEEIVCDPDAPLTPSPQLVVTQAKAGRYGVWIGRTDMQTAIDGRLSVTLNQQ